MSIVVDEEGSRIVVIYNGIVVLKTDPEQKRIVVRCVRIATKPLGVGAERIVKEELVSDSTPLITRMMELGMDSRTLTAALSK